MGNYIQYKNFRIYYVTFGSGPEPLLAFPGFHRECTDFDVFSSILEKKFTTYSFDLFYHGKTEIQGSQTEFFPEDLKSFVQQFLEEKKIKSFSLLGYSLGGKLCLMLMESFPKSLNSVYLLAPYGIVQSKLVQFLEKFKISGTIFHFLIKNPRPYFSCIRILFFLRIITQAAFDFLMNQMGSEVRRNALYNVWKIYYHMRPNIPLIQHLVDENLMRVCIFNGEMDPIEPPSRGQFFASGIRKKIDVYRVPLSHNLVCPKMNMYLANAL